MRFCPYCGSELSENAKFCTACGAKQELSAEPVVVPVEQPVEVSVPVEEPVQQVVPPVQPDEPPAESEEPTQPQEKTLKYTLAKGGATPEKGLNKKLFLFGGIGLAVILVAILLIALLAGGGEEKDPVVGRYEAISCTVDDGERKTEDEWIELKKNGKAKLHIRFGEFSAQWSAEGEMLTLIQSGDTYSGTLKNGRLHIDFAGASYVFVKKAEDSDTSAAAGVENFKAVSCVMDGESIDTELIAMLGGCYVQLGGDGKGTFFLFGEQVPITYDAAALTIDGNAVPYSLKGDQMEFTYVDGSAFVLERTEEDPAEAVPSELNWETGEWEEQDVTAELLNYLDWPGQAFGDLDITGLTVELTGTDLSGTLWLEKNADGKVLVESVHLYLYNADYESLRELLSERYGAPTEEGEEPYAAANGGAVSYSWFRHPAGSLRLLSASEKDYLEIIVNAE